MTVILLLHDDVGQGDDDDNDDGDDGDNDGDNDDKKISLLC